MVIYRFLLTILDETVNGGYSFEGEYRWYKNDSLIDGETKAFLYLLDGETFAPNDCYYVVLTRKDDGVAMRSCEICPGIGTSINDIFDFDGVVIQNTLLSSGERICIDNLDDGYVNIYTLMGQLLYSYKASSADSMVFAPEESGFYLLHILGNREQKVYKIKVK